MVRATTLDARHWPADTAIARLDIAHDETLCAVSLETGFDTCRARVDRIAGEYLAIHLRLGINAALSGHLPLRGELAFDQSDLANPTY